MHQKFNFSFSFIARLLLTLIILMSFWLRFTQLEKMVWAQDGYDEQRDMLVVKHIVEYGESTNRGPLAAGANNWLRNSPVYFYFISFIWIFSKDPIKFMYLWAALHALLPLLGYLTGKEIKGKKLGLMFALAMAVQPELVYESRQLLQPFLLPFFSLISLWMIAKLYHQLKLSYLLILIASFLLPLHFHYGIFLLLPMGFCWVVFFWIKLLKKNSSLKNIILPIITTLVIMIPWLFLTYSVKPLDQFMFLVTNFEQKHPGILFQLKDIFSQSSKILWRDDKYIYTQIILIIVLLGLIKVKKQLKYIIYIFLSLIGSLFFMVVSSGWVSETYILSPFLILFLFLIFCFYLIIDKNRWVGYLLFSLFIVFQFSHSYVTVYYYHPEQSFYNQIQVLAKTILNDYRQHSQHPTQSKYALAYMGVNLKQVFDGWGINGLWYWLEILENKKLIQITNYGVNTRSIANGADILYLICDHRYGNVSLREEACLNPFSAVRNYLLTNQIIFESEYYTIWRFFIHPDFQHHYTYNFVYR